MLREVRELKEKYKNDHKNSVICNFVYKIGEAGIYCCVDE